MRSQESRHRGFSIIEVLVSLAIVGVLLGLLLPALVMARDSARSTLCAGNLRQIGSAWQMYLGDHEEFPSYGAVPEWAYGGASFVGPTRSMPVLDAERPINRYIATEESEGDPRYALLFRCPSDMGVWMRSERREQHASILPNDGTCFRFFGTSYRANGNLMDARAAGIDPVSGRSLRLHEISGVSPSRLLMTGDAAWYYATRETGDPDAALDASWHHKTDAGNLLAADGSVRFADFRDGQEREYTIWPRPDRRTETGR